MVRSLTKIVLSNRQLIRNEYDSSMDLLSQKTEDKWDRWCCVCARDGLDVFVRYSVLFGWTKERSKEKYPGIRVECQRCGVQTDRHVNGLMPGIDWQVLFAKAKKPAKPRDPKPIKTKKSKKGLSTATQCVLREPKLKHVVFNAGFILWLDTMKWHGYLHGSLLCDFMDAGTADVQLLAAEERGMIVRREHDPTPSQRAFTGLQVTKKDYLEWSYDGYTIAQFHASHWYWSLAAHNG